MEHLSKRARVTPQQRFFMTAPTVKKSAPIWFDPYRLHDIEKGDVALVGKLMSACFRGSIDDAGESDEDWQKHARKTFRNGICEISSVMATLDDEPVAAMVVVATGRARLLAIAMTHPEHQGKGLAEKLLRKCLDRLATAGIWNLSLCVTEGNVPALRLYEKLGFTRQNKFAHLKVVID